MLKEKLKLTALALIKLSVISFNKEYYFKIMFNVRKTKICKLL